jgi:hypothetical protein
VAGKTGDGIAFLCPARVKVITVRVDPERAQLGVTLQTIALRVAARATLQSLACGAGMTQ